MSDMPETIWANTKSVWSKFELPATNKGEQKSGRKCAPRTKYIRADLATYNPETHILIAKDEVPQGLGEAVARMLRDNQIHRHDEEKFELIAELVAAKMGMSDEE